MIGTPTLTSTLSLAPLTLALTPIQGKRGYSFCFAVDVIAVFAVLICILTTSVSQVNAPHASFNLNPCPDPYADLSFQHRHISAIFLALSAIGVAIAAMHLTLLLPCNLISKSLPLV